MYGNETNFALVLELNGDMLNKSNVAMNILLDLFSISHISSRSPCPHIVINAGFKIHEIAYFQRSLEVALRNARRFTIWGRGLGVFVSNTPVVHIRWNVDESLNEFSRQISAYLVSAQNQGVISSYSQDLNWVPKTTLGFEDTSYEHLSGIIGSINST